MNDLSPANKHLTDPQIVIRPLGQSHAVYGDLGEVFGNVVCNPPILHHRVNGWQVAVVLVSGFRGAGDSDGVPDVMKDFVHRSVELKFCWAECLSHEV